MKFGFTTTLVLIFITLKLTGNIVWSWWWIFSPWWISTIAWVIFFAIYVMFQNSSGYGRVKTKKRSRNDWKKLL